MIYINGRFLLQDLTGVQRFATEISKALNSLRDDIVFLVPESNELDCKLTFPDLNIKVVKGFKGHLWEQITLPLFLIRNKRPLLLNLCNTAPVFYKNQIATHHDITYLKFPKSFSFSFRFVYKILSPLMIKNSKALITVSEFSKSEICDYYKVDPVKVNVVYNATNVSFRNNENIRKKRYILAVSSPSYHKNFHGLINAFRNSDLDVELKIIGKASGTLNNAKLEENDPRIEYLGRVSDEDLIKYYQEALMFVFPSLYEGFGIPPLEAQACGTPVISSNRASMKEVLAESALFFDPTSEKEIVTCIKSLASDEVLVSRLISSGFENVKRFSWENSATSVNDLISKLN